MSRPQPPKPSSLQPPKSILKKTSNYRPSSPTPLSPTTPLSPGISRDNRNRELALYHANLIQHRKDVEAAILESIEILLEFPQLTEDPASPNIGESQELKDRLRAFQPADFDSLVEERNIDGRCGYALCPRPHRVEKTTGKFRILQKGGHGPDAFRVVKKADLEKWCSESCGRFALFLRVQLSETPAWERRGQLGGDLELFGESPKSPMSPRAEGVDRLARDLDRLAIERGDRSVNSQRPSTVQFQIQERPMEDAPAPQQPNSFGKHAAIDGYTPKMNSEHGQRVMRDDDDDDMMDTC